MNRVILQLLAVGFCFAIGQALQCYNCDLGVGNVCLTTKITCKEGELCYSGVGSAAGLLEIKMKGCLEVSKCNQTEMVNFPSSSNSSIYKMTKTCCNTDLCNAAPGLPAVPAFSMALATITALYFLV